MAKSDVKYSSSERFVAIVLALALYVPLALYIGNVTRDLWSWFAVPVGASPISLAQAIGVGILSAYFIRGLKHDLGGDDLAPVNRALCRAIYILISASLFWGIGACWHHYMPAVAS